MEDANDENGYYENSDDFWTEWDQWDEFDSWDKEWDEGEGTEEHDDEYWDSYNWESTGDLWDWDEAFHHDEGTGDGGDDGSGCDGGEDGPAGYYEDGTEYKYTEEGYLIPPPLTPSDDSASDYYASDEIYPDSGTDEPGYSYKDYYDMYRGLTGLSQTGAEEPMLS